MRITNKNFMTLAVLIAGCLCACSPTGPDADTVVAVSYNIFGEAPFQTLTVDATTVRFESRLDNLERFNYDTVEADAAFLGVVRSTFNLSEVRGLTDRVDTGKLAVDVPLVTITISYRLKDDLSLYEKIIKYTDPAHDELTNLDKALEEKAGQLRR